MIDIYRKQRGAVVVFEGTPQISSGITSRITLHHHRYVYPGQGVLRYDPELQRHVYTLVSDEIDFVGECDVVLQQGDQSKWKRIRVLPNTEPNKPLIYFEIAGPNERNDDLAPEVAAGPDLDAFGLNVGMMRREDETDAQFRARIRAAMASPVRGTLGSIRAALEGFPGIAEVRSVGDNYVSRAIDVVVEIHSYTTSALMRAEIMELLDEVRPAGSVVNLTVCIRCGYCDDVHDDRIACPAYLAAEARSMSRCGLCNASHSVGISCGEAAAIRSGVE